MMTAAILQASQVSERDARRLAYLAVIVAAEAPARRHPNSVSASISWAVVEEIRAAMTAAGFDVPALIKRTREIKNARAIQAPHREASR
jgi:hypothetical protein